MHKTAIVIGSGFGGLALAIRLQAKGIKTTILEKNSMVGGHASQLKKAGYTFDLGPSLITAPQIIDDIFTAAGKRMADYLELIPLDPYYRIYFHDKSYIDYTGDSDRMKQQISAYSQHDAANYDRFMNYAEKLYKAVIVEKLGAEPFVNWWTFLRYSPQLLALQGIVTCYWMVCRFFKHPKTRFVFSFHPLFIGGNPFRAPALFLMIPYLEKVDGVWFTKGGMYSVVEALAKVFTEIGGEIRTNAEVTEIIVKGRKAIGIKVNQQVVSADIIVSNAHVAHTYKDLVSSNNRRNWTDAKVSKSDYSMSSVLIYLGVKKQYPQLLHHTLILSERYRELIADIFDRKVLADDFSMYLHAPTRTDPGMAPAGSESMYVLIPVPNLSADIDWETALGPYVERILEFLEQDFGLTGLRANIEVQEVFGPKDFAKLRNNYLGAPWSLEPKLLQIANLRAHNRSEDIQNLYLVGASVHPGGGVPGVMLSAETTEKLIWQDISHNQN